MDDLPATWSFLTRYEGLEGMKRLFEPGVNMAEIVAFVLFQLTKKLESENRNLEQSEKYLEEDAKVLRGNILRLMGEKGVQSVDLQLLRKKLEEAEALGKRYTNFYDDIYLQFNNWGFVDEDLFSMGHIHILSDGKAGRKFVPDVALASDRAAKARQVKFIRKLAEKHGLQIASPAKKDSSKKKRVRR
jgi:hypothetical protein